MMINVETVCNYLNDNTVLVRKGDTVTAVTCHLNKIVVTSLSHPLPDQPFVALAKVYGDMAAARYDWAHVIGKMVLKNKDSKYFDAPRHNEHMSNGNADFQDYPAIVQIARDVTAEYERYKKENR